MNPLEPLQASHIWRSHLDALVRNVSDLLPQKAQVLDVGCGDGRVAAEIVASRPDITIQGLEVLLRQKSFIPVSQFDGRTLPEDDRSFDVVMFVDVLHHTDDPMPLLREAARVTRHAVVVKDHLPEGFLAWQRLRLMDWIGNARFGVSLPYNYWSRERWLQTFTTLELDRERWIEAPFLFPWWANWFFGGSLHFLARLIRRR